MYCNQCGRQIINEEKFCQGCGVSSDKVIPAASEMAKTPELVKGWRRVKYILASLVLLALSFSWIYDLTAETGSGEDRGLIMAFIFGLWGSAILTRAFNKTISGIIKNFFQMKAIRTSGGILKKLLKFAFWAGLVGLVIWLIVALGPLWIIAIILLLILFVVANR